jgi:hypothetical protein
MLWTRGFSLTNFLLGTSSLAFSLMVLYPWHHRLDDDFRELMAQKPHVSHSFPANMLLRRTESGKKRSGWRN